MRSFKFINLLFVLLVLVLALPVVGFARQIVTVYGDENSSRAQLKFGEYSSDSKYTEYLSTEAIVGKNGITFNKKCIACKIKHICFLTMVKLFNVDGFK